MITLIIFAWLIAVILVIFKTALKGLVKPKVLSIYFEHSTLTMYSWWGMYYEYVFLYEKEDFKSEDVSNPYSAFAKTLFDTIRKSKKRKLSYKVIRPLMDDIKNLQVEAIDFEGNSWEAEKPQDLSDSPYSVLGLKSGTDYDIVKQRYRDLAKIYHPDVCSASDSSAMVKINNAFNSITQSRSR